MDREILWSSFVNKKNLKAEFTLGRHYRIAFLVRFLTHFWSCTIHLKGSLSPPKLFYAFFFLSWKPAAKYTTANRIWDDIKKYWHCIALHVYCLFCAIAEMLAEMFLLLPGVNEPLKAIYPPPPKDTSNLLDPLVASCQCHLLASYWFSKL